MGNPFETIDERLSKIEQVLLDINQKISENSGSGSSPDADRWFGIKELCEYLPDKPAISTIYSQVHLRTIPFHKGAKHLRFLKSEIDSWLKSGKRMTSSEIKAEASKYIDGKRTAKAKTN